MLLRHASVVVLLFVWGSATALTTTEQLARDILAELVAIDTSHDGDTRRTREAADLLAARLKRAGFPSEPGPDHPADGGRGNHRRQCGLAARPAPATARRRLGLNTDAGYVELTRDGRPNSFVIQTAEKIYASFALEASSPGGHSSRPTADNAIYKLARGLQRLEPYKFPRALNETARVYFERWVSLAPTELQPGARALGAGRLDDPAIATVEALPYLNALFHTTCVATQLSGGGSENALPERARAVVNCRILPESSPAAVEAVLRDLVAADGVTVTPAAPASVGPSSPPSISPSSTGTG